MYIGNYRWVPICMYKSKYQRQTRKAKRCYVKIEVKHEDVSKNATDFWNIKVLIARAV